MQVVFALNLLIYARYPEFQSQEFWAVYNFCQSIQ